MRKIGLNFIVLLVASFCIINVKAQPAKLVAPSIGVTTVNLYWDAVANATSYKVETSTDSITFTAAGTPTTNFFLVKGLTENKKYYFRVKSIENSVESAPSTISATTRTKLMLHLPLDTLVGDTAIYNGADKSLKDKITEGTIKQISATETGIGVSAIKFTASDLPPIKSTIRLWKTLKVDEVNGINAPNPQRTMSIWIKNESPNKAWSTIFNWGKRSGFTLTIKAGVLYALTGVYYDKTPISSLYTFAADSISAPFTSSDWSLITYVYDHPITKLYINGTLVGSSDGKFYHDKSKTLIDIPYMHKMFHENSFGTTGQDAELGNLFNAAFGSVYYLKDTWDNGGHAQGFNGLMSDMKMYNYALSDADIKKQFTDKIVSPFLQANGVDNQTIRWVALAGVTSYNVKKSTDGVTYTSVETTDKLYSNIKSLTENTKYYYKVIPQGGGDATSTVLEATTVKKDLVAHIQFNELQGDTAIKCSVSNKVDKISGPVTIAQIASDTVMMNGKRYMFKEGTKAANFGNVVPLNAYVMLNNIATQFTSSLNQRTISFWMKSNVTKPYMIPLSFDKRSGLTIAIKNDTLYAFTKSWPRLDAVKDGDGGLWYADSISAPISSIKWNHVTYVYDAPKTRIYINGKKVGESDGMFYVDKTKTIVELPYMSEIQNIASQQKSNEIGVQFDGCVGTVKYLKDTWDGGVHGSSTFNGKMTDLRFYNYAVADADIVKIVEEKLNLDQTSVESIASEVLSVYPNPANDIINFGKNVSGIVSIIDQVGKVVLNQTLINENSLSISGIEPGVYVIKLVKSNNDIQTVKMSIK